jgi:hypothetical protein
VILRPASGGAGRTGMLLGLLIIAAGCGGSARSSASRAARTSDPAGSSASRAADPSASAGPGAAGQTRSSAGESDAARDGDYPAGWPKRLRVPDGARITSHLRLAHPSRGTVRLLVTAKLENASPSDVYALLASEVTSAGYKITDKEKSDRSGLFLGQLTAVKRATRDRCRVSVNAIRGTVDVQVTVDRPVP